MLDRERDSVQQEQELARQHAAWFGSSVLWPSLAYNVLLLIRDDIRMLTLEQSQ